MIATVPKDRLLIHQAKEGYRPICEFLGLPVPDEPYPRINDTASIQAGMRETVRRCYGIVFGVPALLGVAAYFLMQWIG